MATNLHFLLGPSSPVIVLSLLLPLRSIDTFMAYVKLLCNALLARKACPFMILQYKSLPALFVFVACVLKNSATREVSKSFSPKIPW